MMFANGGHFVQASLCQIYINTGLDNGSAPGKPQTTISNIILPQIIFRLPVFCCD